MKLRKQKGSVGIAVAGVIAVLAAGCVFSYFSAASYGNRTEVALKTGYDDGQNILSSGYQQLKGVAGVTKLATQDQRELFDSVVTGRYGPNGSQAVFQMITEQNPVQDPKLYQKVQQVVEGTQKEFQNWQTGFLDKRGQYETALGSPWQGMWLGFAGYPKVDPAKYKIISSAGASEAFRTGQQAAPDFGR